MTLRRPAALLLVLALVGALAFLPPAPTASAASAARAVPKWIQRIDTVVGDRPMSVAIGIDGDVWYRHLAWVRRPPASNEKLLLSMALLDRFSPQRTIRTAAMSAATPTAAGVLRGDLWLVGHGDPEVNGRTLAALAHEVADAGVTKIKGSVIGDTGPFGRDWFAPGWKDYFPADYVALPTALTFRRNVNAAGRHITDPEERAAKAMTAKLEALGVTVTRDPSMGGAPGGMTPIATVDSAPLVGVLRRMNFDSRNFFAEVLGKYLGAQVKGKGTIANGAAAIAAFVKAHGLSFACYDGSGLSYDNRVSARGMLDLLWATDAEPWGPTLRSTLPSGGRGTLQDRLTDVRIRAKTGTLYRASALSGWLWLERSQRWVEFSIVSNGFDERVAKKLENRIVEVVARNASDPTP
ncbi:MAG: D-alanyl-D-alanine carboxypeptidase/D-alanyl-D-alanine-endopeptidase [Planctomycetaceae bacterium]